MTCARNAVGRTCLTLKSAPPVRLRQSGERSMGVFSSARCHPYGFAYCVKRALWPDSTTAEICIDFPSKFFRNPMPAGDREPLKKAQCGFYALVFVAADGFDRRRLRGVTKRRYALGWVNKGARHEKRLACSGFNSRLRERFGCGRPSGSSAAAAAARGRQGPDRKAPIGKAPIGKGPVVARG